MVSTEEYYQSLMEDALDRRHGEADGADDVAPIGTLESAFTEVLLETLLELGQVGDVEPVFFEKKIGRSNAKANGYCVIPMDSQIEIIVTVFGKPPPGPPTLQTVPGGEIDTAVLKALHVFRASQSRLFEDMEPSSASHDMMQSLHAAHEDVLGLRIVVLVNGVAARPPAVDPPDDVPGFQIDVWDVERLRRADASGRAHESLTIDVEEYLGAPLPCITADTGADDHRCYLAIIPGVLLHDLYQKHGPRLLELNVRSFLQARGKVNRGIRNTLQHDPGHFLAFNNGISVTAEKIEFAETSGAGLSIRSIVGLQIVNGGQTTASIHRAGSRDKVELSQVFVQAKISVIEEGHLETLVSSISRFSNTQNKVNETDFSANHPFHVRFQQLSQKIWAPGQTTRWFYERARGQWEVARSREGTTPARKRVFDAKTPRQQRIDKTLLAKASNAWSELPEVVSLGGQKSFVRFMEDVGKKGREWEPDEKYFRASVAKVILFKRSEKIARQIGFSAYRANAVAYTVALLAYRTAGRIDLERIWADQDVSPALEDTLRAWMPRVHEEIVDSAGDKNVTEWCKKRECWTHMQSLPLDFAPGFDKELEDGLPLPTVGAFGRKSAKGPVRLTAEERDRQAFAMKYSSDEWLQVVEWGSQSGLLSPFHISLAGTMLSYAAAGWRNVPSPKQTVHARSILDAWEEHRASPD